MEYEFIPGATITIIDVCKSNATSTEFTRFNDYWAEKGFSRNQKISVDKKLLSYCDRECFVNWLIEIGKLKKAKKFQPFTIEIPINSPEEYWEVWHRMNAGKSWFNGYKDHVRNHPNGELNGLEFGSKNSHKLWGYVEMAGITHKMHSKER